MIGANGVDDSNYDQLQNNTTNEADAANERSLCVATPGSPTKSRAYVDHTYRDFSRYLKEGGEIVEHKKSSANFPAKLHLILSKHEFSHIIAWMPHGRAWKILDKELLTTTVIPAYFAQSKFHSFTRQLNCWNFKRLHQKGLDFGCYYHEKFLRGLSELTVLMVRSNVKQGKLLPFAKGEPNFYQISKFYPLPPLPMNDFDQNSFPLLAKPTELRAVMMPASHLTPYRNDIPTFDLSSTPSPKTAPPAHINSSTRFSKTACTMSAGMHPLSSSISSPFVPSTQTDQHRNILPVHKTSGTPSSTSAVTPFEKAKCPSPHRVPTTINVQNPSTDRAAQEPPRSSARAQDSLAGILAMARAPAQLAQKLHPPSYSCHTQNAADPAIFLSAPTATSSHRNYQGGGGTNQTQLARVSVPDGKNSRSEAGSFSPASIITLINHLQDPQQENDRVQNNDSHNKSLSTLVATSYSNHQHHDGQCQPPSMFHHQESITINPKKQDHSGSLDGSYEGESDFDNDMISFLEKNGL